MIHALLEKGGVEGMGWKKIQSRKKEFALQGGKTQTQTGYLK
jgi:hypothetical protein